MSQVRAERPTFDETLSVVERHWGYRTLRPLQAEAMQAVLTGRDSLLVLPTGGGKSLCYQAPAVAQGGTMVVVSPLISLMKDQVDALRQNGVAAAALNSSLAPPEAREIEQQLQEGRFRLVYVSPERLALPGFRRFLRQVGVSAFAIDEAHCISHWGHDFRPEYRLLSELRTEFPEASLHGFTATATEQVRRDIATQLGLRDPVVLVGNFDRPNLFYRVLRRDDYFSQVMEVLQRHHVGQSDGDAGIIYCIRRRDVDDLTAALVATGIRALPYHAGLSPAVRKSTQDAFSTEKCDLVVATVAFGMGIDRSNVRFVIHTGMPKSIEHYQQETGRAGRDGLEAELVLLYSGSDAMLWRDLMMKSVGESETPVDPLYLRSVKRQIDDMEKFCMPVRCRHRALVEYFGQRYPQENCAACDVCLGDEPPLADGQTIARKILSCVARVDQRFGEKYVIAVLLGKEEEPIRARGHDRLSTFGLLREFDAKQIRGWIDQLLSQDALARETNENGDYPVLKLNEASWEVMRDQRPARLVAAAPAKRKRRRGEAADLNSSATPRAVRSTQVDAKSWAGVDKGLFEALRTLRRELAEARGLPPFVIFSDASLRDLARRRPARYENLRLVYGIGEAKLEQFGDRVWSVVEEYCRKENLSRDNNDRPGDDDVETAEEPRPTAPRALTPAKVQAFTLFRQNKSLDEVVLATGRAYSTLCGYLADFIQSEKPESIAPWVNDAMYSQVRAAAEREGNQRLKPIFAALEEKVPYDAIRLVLAHLAAHRDA